MAFGLNMAQIIGRLGADVTINHLTSGGRVANMSIATDESYIDRNGSGERVDRTEWHRVVTFQNGLVDMLEKHAKKGRLVYVAGKLQTRSYRKDGEDSDRFSTEILPVPGGRVQFPREAGQRQRHPGVQRRDGPARRVRAGHLDRSGTTRSPSSWLLPPTPPGPVPRLPARNRPPFCSRARDPGRAGRRNASPGAAHSRVSPSMSSFPAAETSTTTSSSPSAPP